jgi:hypothetical protein
MSTQTRRRLRVITHRGLRLARRNFVTLVSACVLGVAAYLALTSGGFDSPRNAGTTAQADSVASAVPAVATPTRASVALSARPRHLAIVYVVTTEEQGANVLATHNRLVWDTITGDEPPNLPDIHYVVAGTPEEQSLTIQQLNTYIEVANLQGFDLEVIDLRPGRGVAANTGSP